ncbi:MAG: ACT domain-containing protein [Planctomycetes bacterium]|nr:ACT domain-containing protein [Planctomycetota bacterium]
MKILQVSVFIENRPGRLLEVTGILADAGINIIALELADTSDYGILRMIVDRPQEAQKALSSGGLTVITNDVVVVDVANRPGGLKGVLKILSDAGANVEYMYGFSGLAKKSAALIFRFEDSDKAVKILLDNGMKVIESINELS